MFRRGGALPEKKWLFALSPLLIGFFYAPLAWGATTPETVAVLDVLCVASFLIWVCKLVVERRGPSFSRWCWIPLVFVSILGAIHWANPKSVFYEIFWVLNPIESSIHWLPGSVDRVSTQEVIIHLYALLAGFVVLLDACSHSRTRWLLFKAVAISGFVIALIGITQKAVGADAMLWVEPDPLKYGNKLFFAAFRYHANAASFLNLCWPAALIVFLRERESGRKGVLPSLWATVLLITIIGVFVNTSKAGPVLAGLGLILALMRFWRSIFVGSKVVIALTSILLVGFLLIFVLPALPSLEQRWAQSNRESSLNGRLEAYEVCLRMIADKGITTAGTGPGTFRLVFPFYENEDSNNRFFWYHAHQDFLQTIIEWGIFGALGWFLFLGGGIVRGFSSVRLSLEKDRMEFSASCALIAMIVVMAHATFDFPFQIPSIQILIAFYMAVLWASGTKKARKKPANAGLES